MSNFTGKTALVTGASRGIGRAIALELAAAGATVIINYNSNTDAANAVLAEIRANGGTGHIHPADVSDADAVTAMFKTIKKEHGSIDILVNNAGITRDTQFKKMRAEQWSAVINTNLNSLYNVTRPAVERMIERQFGRVINISSVSGQRGQFGQTNYAAAKAGVHGFTMSLAREVAQHGVTVNSISPGYIATEMVQAMREDVLAQVVEQIPVGRMGQPSDIGRAVAFLANEDSAYITGSDLFVNGGLYM